MATATVGVVRITKYSIVYICISIGGHLVRYPWSAISDWAWYQTERAESDIISDIRIMFYPISDIRHLGLNMPSQQLSVIALAYHSKGRGFESVRWHNFFLWCRISEWTLMSISEHFRYQNDVFQSDIFVSDIGIGNRCRCRMSDIADIEIDVDAHLCIYRIYSIV